MKNMSCSLLAGTKRRNIGLQLSLGCQFNLVLTGDGNAVLPFRNRRRLYTERTRKRRLGSKVGDGLCVVHGAILGAPNLFVKECLTDFVLGLPI